MQRYTIFLVYLFRLQVQRILPKLFLLVFLFQFLTSSIHAQDFDPDSKIYNKVRKALKKWESADKDPFASSVTYPEKWKDESVIILYRRHSNDYRLKSPYGFTRIRLKLNDMAAVETFSYLEFSSNNFLDVKIIKPDGRVEKVNLKNAFKQELKFNKPGYNAIFASQEYRIPLTGLEPGDILDVATLTRHQDYDSYLTAIYPTRYFRLDAVGKRRTQIIAQSLNGAAKMKMKRIKGGYYYELTDSLIEKSRVEVNAVRYLSEPIVRFTAIDSKIYKRKAFNTKNGFIIRELSEAEIAKYYRQYTRKPYRGVSSKYYYEFLKEYGYKLPAEEYFVKYYYFCRDRMYKPDIALNQKTSQVGTEFLRMMVVHLKKRNIPYRFVLLPSKYTGGLKNILFERDFNVGLEVILPERTYYITEFGPYTHPDMFTEDYEGMDVLAFSRKDTRKKRVGEKIKMESSSAATNSTTIQIEAKLLSFPDTFLMKQTNIVRGYNADGLEDFGNNYKQLLDDYSTQVRIPKYHNKKYPLLFFTRRELYAPKTSLDFIKKEEERKELAYLQNREKERKERWKKSLKEEYLVFSVDTIIPFSNGGDPEKRELKFYSEYKIGDMLAHADNRYILNVGAMLGSLPEINQMRNRLERKQAFYNDYNRELKMVLDIEVPYNMSVSDLNQLNTSFENKLGNLVSTASMQGRILHWELTLVQTGFEYKVEDWPAYLALTDALSALTKVQLVSEN